MLSVYEAIEKVQEVERKLSSDDLEIFHEVKDRYEAGVVLPVSDVDFLELLVEKLELD